MPYRYSLLLIVVFFWSCGSESESIKPKKTTLIESVYASALIQPDSLYDVYSIATGILEEQYVDEGHDVNKGTALFQIFNKTPELNSANAKINLQQAQDQYKGDAAVLDGLQKEISTATLKLENDSINYYRQARLWEQEIGSKAEYDLKKLNFELSQNNLNVLKNNYNRTKLDLKNRVTQANNSYKAALVTTNDFTIKSKITGRVYAIYKNIGELITTMEPLASIGSSDSYLIELLVDEVDIVKLKTNQKVIISLDAYKGEIFEGKIDKIYPQKDERSQTFTVEAVFNEAPKTLYPGLAGEANIIISEKSNTLTIPLEYLIKNNQVNTPDGLVTVTTGVRNMKEVEILSGIDENTEILKPEE